RQIVLLNHKKPLRRHKVAAFSVAASLAGVQPYSAKGKNSRQLGRSRQGSFCYNTYSLRGAKAGSEWFMKILIADDHQMFRQGLRLLLESQPDVDVVAETGDGRSAVRLAIEHAPDIVVMDVSMPDLNGIDATRQIVAAATNGKIAKVIGLSAHSD